ncbi:MAG: ring-cleaving dioxygenase, partial [Verrucomicrobia bacterium]|nr:ring-cleaving dioxygenase [Verrucomicrobiota bacterium]
MNAALAGLHHVTAIASDPQRNLDFYVGLLGLRLVKRTVNFDDPGTYHFYFGDARGTPGTILTFFPWPGARRGVRGAGQVAATAFAIPEGSVGFWLERCQAQRVRVERAPARFGEEMLRLADPDGLPLELVVTAAALSAVSPAVQPWAESTVPAAHALRGFHSVTLGPLGGGERTAALLTEIFGYQRVREEAGKRWRFAAAAAGKEGVGRLVDLLIAPEDSPGHVAAGSVHHVAFRVADEAQQRAWRERLLGLGYHVSPVMDRTYFRSIYFREPGGVLFELATDAPGFTVDEAPEELGTHLRLPPAMERERAQIEQILPA